MYMLDYKRQRKSEGESCSVLSNSLQPHGLYSPCNSPGQNTGVGSLSLLQGIFPTQGSHPCLLHCGWILYQLSHKSDQRLNCQHFVECNSIPEKKKYIYIYIYFCFTDCVDHSKLWKILKGMGIPDHLMPPDKPVCR